jgi:hypothetical protein
MVSRSQIDKLASRIDQLETAVALPEELEKELDRLGPIKLSFDNTHSPVLARQAEIHRLLVERGVPVETRVILVFD